MGAQKAPETARGRRPQGAHFRHLQGALIGPAGGGIGRPKRLTKRAFWTPILVTRRGTLIGPCGWWEWAPKRRPKRQREGDPRAPIPVTCKAP